MNMFESYMKNAARFLNEDFEDEVLGAVEPGVAGEEELGIEDPAAEELQLDDEEELDGEEEECEESMEELKAQIADLQAQVTELLELVQTLTGEDAELADEDELAGEDELEGEEEIENEEGDLEGAEDDIDD